MYRIVFFALLIMVGCTEENKITASFTEDYQQYIDLLNNNKPFQTVRILGDSDDYAYMDWDYINAFVVGEESLYIAYDNGGYKYELVIYYKNIRKFAYEPKFKILFIEI